MSCWLKKREGSYEDLFSKGNMRWAASSEEGGGLLKKTGAGFLRTLWRSLRSLTPLPPFLSVSPWFTEQSRETQLEIVGPQGLTTNILLLFRACTRCKPLFAPLNHRWPMRGSLLCSPGPRTPGHWLRAHGSARSRSMSAICRPPVAYEEIPN